MRKNKLVILLIIAIIILLPKNTVYADTKACTMKYLSLNDDGTCGSNNTYRGKYCCSSGLYHYEETVDMCVMNNYTIKNNECVKVSNFKDVGYQVTFNANGGKIGSGDDKEEIRKTLKSSISKRCEPATSGGDCKVFVPIVSKAGDELVGWDTNKNCTSDKSFIEISPISKGGDAGESYPVTIKSDITFYACWKNVSGGETAQETTETPTGSTATDSNNPTTGSGLIYVAWVVGAIAIGYACFSFKKVFLK